MIYTVSRITSEKDGTVGFLEQVTHPSVLPRVFVIKDGDIEHCTPDAFHSEGSRARTFFCGVYRPDSFEVLG